MSKDKIKQIAKNNVNKFVRIYYYPSNMKTINSQVGILKGAFNRIIVFQYSQSHNELIIPYDCLENIKIEPNYTDND